MASRVAVVFLALAFQVSLVYCIPSEFKEEWSFQCYFGDSISLICNDNETNLQSKERVEWKLPSGKVLQPGFNSSSMEVIKEHGIPGYRLLLKSVDQDNRGIYVCYIYTPNGDVRTTAIRAVNLAGALYRNWFDKYVNCLIWGIVAALCILVPCTGGCILYKYRYKPKLPEGNAPLDHYVINMPGNGQHSENNSTILSLNINVKDGVLNKAYTEQEKGELESTKF